MNHLIDYAWSFIGVPYLWGGSSRLVGLDCSGLVQEILKAVGMDPKGDQTAKLLYEHFLKTGFVGRYGPGSLVFYGDSKLEISHVAFMIDENLIIEAGGGGSKTRTIIDANLQNACVRMRPFHYRNDLIDVICPNYPLWVVNG